MTRSRDVSKGATRNEFIYTATSQQTTFSGNDDSSNSLSYTVGQIDVFVNGVRQAPADYTATNGTSVVLGAGASVGDTVQINAFGTFSVSDVIVARAEFDYTATAGQTTFTGNDNDSQSMSYTAGRIDVYLNGSRLNVTDDYVATNGTSVVLQAGAQAGDSLVVVSHGTVNLAANIVAADLDLDGNQLILDADQDTTITADTDDQIDFRIGGSDIFQMTASKLDLNGKELVLDADADTSITADTDDQIDIHIAGADDFKFTANTFHALSGSSVLIGGQTADNIGGRTAIVQIEGTTADTSALTLKCNANDSGSIPTINFGKSRGTSVGSDTIIQDGDNLGVINWATADGTDTVSRSATIFAAVAGSPGANDTPGRLMFEVTADGNSSPTERFRIDQNGDLTATDTSIGSNSDTRLKENISDYTYPIDTFKQFTPKTFTWKNAGIHKSGTQRGFSAQDIESVDNYWASTYKISEKLSDGTDNPDYDLITDHIAKCSKLTEKDAMYISVIKQLIARIEALES